MNRRQTGLTLVELLVALGLLALLAHWGATGLAPLLEQQRRSTLAEDLAHGLRAAKVEAIQRNHRVIVQPIGGNWAQGWHMIADQTGGGAADERNPLLQVRYGQPPARVVPTPNAAAQVAFDYLGRPVLPHNGSLAASLHLCSTHRPGEHLRVVIARTGRIRISREVPAVDLCAP
ncbi:GspH/FimT family protein [Pseudomonas typographi]|uniref:Type II secretion system protein H n=1 Tax=Pseudomonas typographi TaxID=2715964 RepID=A0ABR7YXT5_9PSED|nr:GspH/FimT family protein [Pseudomonas typographi]MBD1587977.1 prepilin-type N-terminal cleavage/methylation domain-containing protein [Pseudomonas typographi]MBD1597966.1 prepilin-type N-terminal cleavage/methylation domain-containing protein [Pseudomonas typographi]